MATVEFGNVQRLATGVAIRVTICVGCFVPDIFAKYIINLAFHLGVGVRRQRFLLCHCLLR